MVANRIIFLISLISFSSLFAQQATAIPPDSLIAISRELIESIPYCALVTTDGKRQPHVRTMEPFQPEQDMTIWFGTNTKSRKVQEIESNPKVTLYYADCDGNGYVSIMGVAVLIDDPEEESRRWKPSWEALYKTDKSNYMLIKVIPKSMEVISYRHNLMGDTVTWKTPSVEF